MQMESANADVLAAALDGTVTDGNSLTGNMTIGKLRSCRQLIMQLQELYLFQLRQLLQTVLVEALAGTVTDAANDKITGTVTLTAAGGDMSSIEDNQRCNRWSD